MPRERSCGGEPGGGGEAAGAGGGHAGGGGAAADAGVPAGHAVAAAGGLLPRQVRRRPQPAPRMLGSPSKLFNNR